VQHPQHATAEISNILGKSKQQLELEKEIKRLELLFRETRIAKENIERENADLESTKSRLEMMNRQLQRQKEPLAREARRMQNEYLAIQNRLKNVQEIVYNMTEDLPLQKRLIDALNDNTESE
jgi:chromosome segregation ATPase